MSRFSVVILLVIAAGFFVSPEVLAIPEGCVSTSSGYTCETEGEAATACEEVRASQSTGATTEAQCLSWGPQRIDCKWVNIDTQAVQAGCNSTAFPNKVVFTWLSTQNCSVQPDLNIFTNNPAPASVCQEGCEYVIGTGVGVCFVSSDSCLTPYVPSGAACPVSGSQTAPEGCSIVSGTVVCDCTLNPDAPFCPGGSNESDATDNGDGTSTADPANPPSSSDPGGPGDGTGDPDGVVPGSCVAGDANCFDSGGGTCDVGETCSTGGVGDGVDETCDPLTQNCEGEGTAGTAGSCAVEPSCDGDAIQCAILVQSWKNTCLALDLAGAKPPWEGDSDYGRDLANEATDVDISSGLDDAGFASGSCPADITIPVFSTSISIGFQPLCDLASIIRLFVILFTLLWAGPFVIRAF